MKLFLVKKLNFMQYLHRQNGGGRGRVSVMIVAAGVGAAAVVAMGAAVEGAGVDELISLPSRDLLLFSPLRPTYMRIF